MEVLGIKFAPLNVPLQRRLETLAAATWFILAGFGNPIGFITAIYLILYTKLCWILIIYCLWIIYDRDTRNKGGRRINWIRNWKLWYYYSRYFPLKLIKTAELDASSNYLLISYPHGLIASGAFGHFATNGTNCKQLFPGLEPNVLTLNIHFYAPFFRDLILGLGLCSATKESMMYLLEGDKTKGKAVVLLAGGAEESFFCKPGTYKIILKKRKGFIRIALQSGTPIVPVFSFGETDLYDQLTGSPGSLLSWFQNLGRKITGISPCVPIGRGFFQYNFGIIPRRHPVTTVVGSPIYVEKNEHPSCEEIEKLHNLFTEKLIELFENYKHKYLPNPEKTELEIL
ncbi:2-acylglycerol O-acyltransferase 2-A-like [Lycorma delicatula]|uniref:2-acylglycerol O-acyltransferase 2-A-like n=1 Tax=Lycorma delicatula TaxID=130591 RepID=UPI003F514B34